jgi:hypothetical protein
MVLAPDSLPVDSSVGSLEILSDSTPASGRAGLAFGANAQIGGVRKQKPSVLEMGGGKAGHFQRRSSMLGLPNRGVFPSKGIGLGKQTQNSEESPWDAYTACETAAAPLGVVFSWESDALHLQSEAGAINLALAEGTWLYLGRCGKEHPQLWDAQGNALAYPGGPPADNAACGTLLTRSWIGPVSCLEREGMALRYVCGNRVVALSKGLFQEFDLEDCAVALRRQGGNIELFSTCKLPEVTCD